MGVQPCVGPHLVTGVRAVDRGGVDTDGERPIADHVDPYVRAVEALLELDRAPPDLYTAPRRRSTEPRTSSGSSESSVAGVWNP
ncbi:hypothetical protein [Streptomyces sp. NPDC020817]|uniref:hypothetical protein n=1 Tax=Streptomyces sp. NPDC020817 TaxID=3365095 RepID=UPI0037958EFF